MTTKKATGPVDGLLGRIDHQRLESQSTSASSSPSQLGRKLGPDKIRKPAAAKSRKTQRVTTPLKGHQKLRLGHGDSFANKSLLVRTPGHNHKQIRRAYIAISPGGTDYIVTPGRNKISLTEFLSNIDRKEAREGCPALRAIANYSECMLQSWLQREKQIDPAVYMLSFKEGSPMEQFRQMAVQSIFNYAVENKLHEKTVHLTCLNINRLIHARFIHSKEAALTHELFACVVMASLRSSVKNDESFEKSDLFRLDPDHVWRASSYLSEVCQDKSVHKMNKVEAECLRYLEQPANPPLAPEFLDRYLSVGGWPQYTHEYRALASYLVGLSLFADASTSSLSCTANSKLAAAALVLAVKVINTDNNNIKYEFWPERLVKYTSMTIEDLKPVIRGLATLLRRKPKWSGVLERYYGKWSEYDWN